MINRDLLIPNANLLDIHPHQSSARAPVSIIQTQTAQYPYIVNYTFVSFGSIGDESSSTGDEIGVESSSRARFTAALLSIFVSLLSSSFASLLSSSPKTTAAFGPRGATPAESGISEIPLSDVSGFSPCDSDALRRLKKYVAPRIINRAKTAHPAATPPIWAPLRLVCAGIGTLEEVAEDVLGELVLEVIKVEDVVDIDEV